MTAGDLQTVQSLKARFTATGDVVYRDLAEGLGLMHMGLAFHRDYLRSHNADDLARAIKVTGQALARTPPGNNDPRAMVLVNLGKMLSLRYERYRTVDDLDRAIETIEAAAEAIDPDNPERAFVLWNLGAFLGTKYQLSGGGVEILNQALQWAEKAVAATPATHPERPNRLNNLGLFYLMRNKETGSLADLGRAIQIVEEAVAATETTNPIRPFLLSTLGMIYQRRYTQQGDKKDIDAAILRLQQAVDTKAGARPEHSLNLGIMVMARYKQFEGAEDLEFSIQCARDAVSAMPVDAAGRPNAVCNLAQMIAIRHARFGEAEDLERAMELMQEGITATHQSSPDRSEWLGNLGLLYERRSQHFGTLEDLEKAIEATEMAITACPPGHVSRATALSNKGCLLERMYQRSGEPNRLDQAVEACESSVLAVPAGGPDRGEKLANVAYVLSQRFGHSDSIADLESAMSRAEEALSLMPAGSPGRRRPHRLLGQLCHLRYKKFAEQDNLVRAIEIYEECLAMVPPDHTERSSTLFTLADIVDSRYRRSGTHQDFFYRLRLLYEAWYCHTAPPQARILAAAAAFAHLAHRMMWQEASSLLADAIRMLHKVDMRSLSMRDQSYRLSVLLPPDLTPTFVSVALQAGEEASHCLRIVEFARGLIIGHAIDFRSDLSRLRSKYPEAAESFQKLREIVDSPPPPSELEMKRETALSSFQQGQRERERAVDDLKKLLVTVRGFPGFEGFHLPPRGKELIAMAAHGPIIFVSSSELRSDAIIVTRTGIESISLNLSGLVVNQQMQNLAGAMSGQRPTYADRNTKMALILEWLWDAIVEPIFTELGLEYVAKTRDLPQVWWIGIGALSIAPFHAAGYHGLGSKRNTMSRAISSYTPTIKALQYTRSRPLVLLKKADPSILVIAMPATPDSAWTELPNAAEEAKQIKDFIGEKVSITLLDSPSAAFVLSQLPTHDAIHFACHGVSNPTDPSRSALLLQGEDGQLDQLTVQKIAGINMKHAQIAFLSACSTAENSSPGLVNESIFIASGFQLAGFSHVLATQWESNDEACKEVSGDFYTFLFDGKSTGGGGDDGGHRKVSASFHQAVKKLRGSNRRQPLKWASFVHLGA